MVASLVNPVLTADIVAEVHISATPVKFIFTGPPMPYGGIIKIPVVLVPVVYPIRFVTLRVKLAKNLPTADELLPVNAQFK